MWRSEIMGANEFPLLHDASEGVVKTLESEVGRKPRKSVFRAQQSGEAGGRRETPVSTAGRRADSRELG